MTVTPHLQRIATALLLLPLLAWAILQGDPILATAITLVSGLGLLEVYAMFWPGRENLWWKAGGLALTVAMIWAPLHWSGTALACGAFATTALAFLFGYDRDERPEAFSQSQVFLFGLLYLPFALRLARHLTGMDIVLVLLATFATDTGAYYAGRIVGGPKIWPSVSPKKTWAGSLGGLLACMLVSTLFGLAAGNAHWGAFALLGLGLNIAAQLGDFFESALKRWRGVKDSGRILPGHGGILDRIDSLLFVLPLYCGISTLFPFFG